MANLTRERVEAFKRQAKENEAAIAALPPAFIEGFTPTLSNGTLTISTGIAFIEDVRINKASTVIALSNWIANRIYGFTYYLYLQRDGSYIVDIIEPEYNDTYFYLAHPNRSGRFICSLSLKSDLQSIKEFSLSTSLAAEEDATILRYKESTETLGGGNASTVFDGNTIGGGGAATTNFDATYGGLSASDPSFRTRSDFYGEGKTLFNWNFLFEKNGTTVKITDEEFTVTKDNENLMSLDFENGDYSFLGSLTAASTGTPSEGSTRVVITTTSLVFQRYESGSWDTKAQINYDDNLDFGRVSADYIAASDRFHIPTSLYSAPTTSTPGFPGDLLAVRTDADFPNDISCDVYICTRVFYSFPIQYTWEKIAG